MDLVTAAKTIIGVSLLIVLHEAGHFLVARLFGMRVLCFSIGFGPSLISKRFGETVYQLAAVPLGGYVHIDGMGPREETVQDGKSFRDKAVWKRMLVIFAGPATNWLLAAAFVCVLAATIGFTRYDDSSTVIGEVREGSPAAAAGLAQGDRVLSANGEAIDAWSELVAIIQRSPEQALALSIERDGAPREVSVIPERDGEVGRLGVGPMGSTVRLEPLAAVGAGATWAWNNTGAYAALLWGVISGSAEGEISGVPGIFKLVSAQAKRGLKQLLETLAWLSIGLCILNLAPIPALDGGRLLFLAIETVRGRPVDERLEGIVHGVGFVLIFGLLILVSLRDILRDLL